MLDGTVPFSSIAISFITMSFTVLMVSSTLFFGYLRYRTIKNNKTQKLAWKMVVMSFIYFCEGGAFVICPIVFTFLIYCFFKDAFAFFSILLFLLVDVFAVILPITPLIILSPYKHGVINMVNNGLKLFGVEGFKSPKNDVKVSVIRAKFKNVNAIRQRSGIIIFQ